MINSNIHIMHYHSHDLGLRLIPSVLNSSSSSRILFLSWISSILVDVDNDDNVAAVLVFAKFNSSSSFVDAANNDDDDNDDDDLKLGCKSYRISLRKFHNV